MDNTRDVRRFGASRFSFAKRQSIKQSGFDGGDDDGVGTISDKSKRRLSVSGTVTEEEEMGCVGSDAEEEELRPTTNNRKRFKLSKKFFDECNNVDHASVPRKLRSAMKKRRGESVSPPLPDTRKVKHMVNGNVLPRKNGTKKSKLSMQNGKPEGSPKQVITGPITRDEEEVVETLFALAGMFSNNDKIDESSKLDSKLSEAKSSTLPESSKPPVLKEEGDLQTNDSSALETAKVQSVSESSQANLPTSQKNPVELDDYVPQGNVTTLPEPTSERPTCNSVGHLVNKHDESSASERKLDIAMEPVPAYRSQIDLQPAITETKNSGSALWPGLSTTGSLDAEICGPPLQSCTAKLPAWMGNASISRQPCSSKNLVLTEKESRVEVGKKNSGKKKNEWKRCSAHVYISRLIKVLQITEGKDALPVQQLNNCDQLKTNEGSNQEAVLAANNNNIVVVEDNKMNSCPNGVVYANNMVFSSDVERSSNEVRNAILLHKRLLQDHNQKQVPTTSGPYASQKQSFDFMSVSAGDYEGFSGNNNRGAANRLESSTPFHVPYLHSIAQNHATMPQNHPFSSSSFPHRFSAATAQQVQQVQLPLYLCSPFSGPSGMESPVLSEQQQLQQLWTAQQAAQYRAGDVIDPTHLPSWQNGRQGGGSPSLIQYAQAMLPPISRSSLELIGPNYATISPQHQQQQQQFISLLPPPSRAKRQHHLPSGYEGKGVPPMQITLQ